MTGREARDETGRVLCPQPCIHLSAEDAREGKECSEHPCTCSERQVRERKALTLAGLDYWAQNAVNPAIREDCARARDLICDLTARREPEITDEMVKAAGRYLEMDTGLETWIDRNAVRLALRAALRVPVETGARD